MKYYSEVTKHYYDNANDCLAEERAELKKQEEAKAAQAKKDAARKDAAAKVDAARKTMVDAQKAYQKALQEFCNTYGAYHYSIDSEDELPHLLDWFNLL